MEFLRYTSNAWGQKALAGLSWDLFWLFFGIGAAFIVVHALCVWRLHSKKSR